MYRTSWFHFGKVLLLFGLVCTGCPEEIAATFPCEEGVSRGCSCETQTGSQLCNGGEWGICLCLGGGDSGTEDMDSDESDPDLSSGDVEVDSNDEDQPATDGPGDPDLDEDSVADRVEDDDIAEGDRDEQGEVDAPDTHVVERIDFTPPDVVADTVVDTITDTAVEDPDTADVGVTPEQEWVSQIEGAVILGDTVTCGETVVISLDYPSARRVSEISLYFAHEDHLDEPSPPLQVFSRRNLEPNDTLSVGEDTSEYAQAGVWRLFVGVIVVHEASGAHIERVVFDPNSPHFPSQLTELAYTVGCETSDILPPESPTLLEVESDLGARDCTEDGIGVAIPLQVSDSGSLFKSASIMWARSDGPFAPLYGSYAPFDDEEPTSFLLNSHIGGVAGSGRYEIASLTLVDHAGNVRRTRRADLAENLRALHVQIDCDSYTMTAPAIESIRMPRQLNDTSGSTGYTISGQLGTGYALVEQMIVEWEPIGATIVGGPQGEAGSCTINGSGAFECSATFQTEYSTVGPWGLQYIHFKFFGDSSDTLLYGDERLPERTLEPAFFLY